MKKKIIIIVITLLFLTNISALITIISNSGIVKKGEILEEEKSVQSLIKEKLNLNESQAAEIEKIRVSFENELENAGIKLNEKQIELFNAVRSENPDIDLINNLIDQISLLQAHLQKEAVKSIIIEKNLLNPVQQERYFSMFDQRFGRGSAFGGKGSMGGRGRGGGRGPRWLRDNNF